MEPDSGAPVRPAGTCAHSFQEMFPDREWEGDRSERFLACGRGRGPLRLSRHRCRLGAQVGAELARCPVRNPSGGMRRRPISALSELDDRECRASLCPDELLLSRVITSPLLCITLLSIPIWAPDVGKGEFESTRARLHQRKPTEEECEMSKPTLTLVRHGQTEWSRTGRHTGRTDVPLTDLGRKQARAIGETLEGTDFEIVESSPLRRASETVDLAGFSSSVQRNDDLVEWDYGEYEGVSTATVREEIAGWTVWTHPIRKGESIAEVGNRADRVIAKLLEFDVRALLFAHGHFLRILAARWVGQSPDVGRHLSLSTASVSRLGLERETRVIESWNMECHLPSHDPSP